MRGLRRLGCPSRAHQEPAILAAAAVLAAIMSNTGRPP